jgi:hypothetical protein
LTDTFIKYALTALPEVPSSIFEQVNLTAAREFQRRSHSDAYSAADLELEE